MDVVVRGAEDFQQLARAIRANADAKALRKELYSGLNSATKGLRTDMRDAIPDALPKRGGLAALMYRDASLTTRSAGGGRNVGVRIVARGRSHDLASMNRGRLRHPTFGHQPTVSQAVRPGFLDTPFQSAAPDVRRAILAVMASVADKVKP